MKLPKGTELIADPSLVLAIINAAPTAEDLEGDSGETAESSEAAAE